MSRVVRYGKTRLRAGALRAVAASGLRPARVEAFVDEVDEPVVGLDVALVARARRRGLDGAEGVVHEVLAEHAPVGDLAPLDRGEVRAGEGVRVDLALDDVVRADILRQLPIDRGVLLASPVAGGEDGDARLVEVDAVLRAGGEEDVEGMDEEGDEEAEEDMEDEGEDMDEGDEAHEMLEEFDADKDGKLSLQELLGDDGEDNDPAREDFKKADKNNDGFLTPDEIPALLGAGEEL